jgi:hypothetical protein
MRARTPFTERPSSEISPDAAFCGVRAHSALRQS